MNIQRENTEGKFLVNQCQVMNTKRMMELENHCLATIIVKTHSGNFNYELNFNEKYCLHSIRVSFH